MARAPAAAAPTDDDEAGEAAAPDAGADQGDQDDEDEGDGGDEDEGAGDEGGEQVLVTITKKSDGTYMVYAGDEEPEEGEGDEDMGGAGAGGAGAPGAGDESMGEGAGGGAPAGAGGAAGEGAPAPQHCDSVGSALKAAADIMHDDEGGEGGGEAAFQAGFGGDATKPTMPQKY